MWEYGKKFIKKKVLKLCFFEESRCKKEMKKICVDKKKLENMSHKELLKEYEKVLAENAYLKKLKALIQEKTKSKKK